MDVWVVTPIDGDDDDGIFNIESRAFFWRKFLYSVDLLSNVSLQLPVIIDKKVLTPRNNLEEEGYSPGNSLV